MTNQNRDLKIGVVIAAYRFSPYLKSCINSIKNQTRSTQIIISTSTPCDELFNLCGQENIELKLHNQGGSIAADWNAALSVSPSTLTLIAHQDDIYYPNFISTCMKIWEKNPDMLFSFTDHDEIDSNGVTCSGLNVEVKRALVRRAFRNSRVASTKAIHRPLFALGNPVCCPSVIINRDRLPSFAFDPDWSINLDWDAWSRICAESGQVGYIPKPLLAHRVHLGSETTNGLRDSRRQSEDLKMFIKFWPKAVAKLIALAYRISYNSNP